MVAVFTLVVMMKIGRRLLGINASRIIDETELPRAECSAFMQSA